MFDLERAIGKWRRELAKDSAIEPSALDELESHLRDALEEKIRAGATVEKAFGEAIAELGSVAELRGEFEDGRGWLPQRVKVVKLLAGLLVAVSALLMANYFSPADARVMMTLSVALAVFLLCLAKFIAAIRYRAGEPDFKNFSNAARHSVQLARLEAPAFHHDFVGTEHLLLGICGEIPELLGRLSLEREKIRDEIVRIVGLGQVREGNLMPPFTPRAKHALGLADEEARRLRHTRTEPEHLFLGLLLEPDGVATRVLRGLGVDIKAARRQVMETLER